VPRRPRIIVPDAIYHVAPIGNDGRRIFVDDHDRGHLLGLIERTTRQHRWIVLGYCLMTNHFHVLLRVGESGLSAGMQAILGDYSRFWNRRHGHAGHLFRNRFSMVDVLSDRHLLASARYIDLNPVRAGMRKAPEDWPWSSYRSHVGLDHSPRFLSLSEFLPLFGSTPAEACSTYRRFVQEGLGPVSDTGFEPPLS
jgi:putative transposase